MLTRSCIQTTKLKKERMFNWCNSIEGKRSCKEIVIIIIEDTDLFLTGLIGIKKLWTCFVIYLLYTLILLTLSCFRILIIWFSSKNLLGETCQVSIFLIQVLVK